MNDFPEIPAGWELVARGDTTALGDARYFDGRFIPCAGGLHVRLYDLYIRRKPPGQRPFNFHQQTSLVASPARTL